MTHSETMPGAWGAAGGRGWFDPRPFLLGAAAAARGGRDRPRGDHGHGHGRGHGRRGGPSFGPGFGFPPPFWSGRGGFRGGRARRGNVRAGILALLDEEPRNGYQIIRELQARSGGAWRPSPGSVYPALQQLEDEGLVRTVESDGRKAYELTDAGREYMQERPDEFEEAPWDAVSGGIDEEVVDLRNVGAQLAAAAMQVAQAGSRSQRRRAVEVLTDARRSLYRILAEDEPSEDTGDVADEQAGTDPPK